MHKSYVFISLFFFISIFIPFFISAENENNDNIAKIDERVKEWTLKDIEEKAQSLEKLAKDKKAVVLIFLATECPPMDDYVDRIVKLFKDYKEKNVQFVGIHSNKHEKIEDIKKYREKHKLKFPILKDPENVIADYFQARRTPEVFVIDSDLKLRYKGAIDDNRKTPKKHYLTNILKLLLDGKVIPDKQKKTRAIGCTIKRVRKADLDRTP